MPAQEKVTPLGHILRFYVVNFAIMHISFNSEIQEIPDSSILFQLLENKELADKKGIAVAVNGNVIPRTKWPETSLQNNDSILVIKAAQGG